MFFSSTRLTQMPNVLPFLFLRVGRVHMQQQNLMDGLSLARLKGLGNRRRVSNVRREGEMAERAAEEKGAAADTEPAAKRPKSS